MGSRGSKSDEAGKPFVYDSSFKGPTKNRGCTDVLCCILLAIFLLAFIAVAIYAFAMGDPRLLIYPVDSNGSLCGSDINSNKPYLLIFDLTKCLSLTGVNVLKMCQGSPQVCVETCPDEFWSYSFSDINKAICTNDVVKATITNRDILKRYVSENKCAPFYMPTAPVVFRCFPTIPGFANGNVRDSNSSDFKISDNQTLKASTFNESVGVLKGLLELQGYGTKILADVTATWWLILLFILLAMVVAFLWIVLMRWIAGVMVWVSLVLFIGFFVFAIYYCFNKYVELKSDNSNKPFIFTTDFQYYASLKETWLAIGIIASIVLAIVLIILLFLIKRIRIAIALIKETSRAISSMMFVLLWPLIPFIMQVGVLVFWGASAICLAAVSRTDNCQIPYNDTAWVSEVQSSRCKIRGLLQQIPCDNETASDLCKNIRDGIKDDRYTIALQAFQLFMWFWLMNFIIALGQVTLAGAFSSYYWAFDKPKDIPTFPVAGSFYRAIRYHMGSMAFGSLLIAIVKMIVALLEYLDHKLKDSQNIVARIVIKCCICFFWCMEKFLKFLNKNAYIMVAIHGKNFCSSAAKAFNLILRNAIRVIVVDKVTDVLLFVNKLFIVGSVGVFAFFTFSRQIPGSERVVPDQLNYYFIPILIVICGSYIVAAVFFSVYDMGVDTLFLCFLEDLERNDGSTEKPYYMSKSLMNILGKSNKPPPYNKVNNV